MARSSIVPDVTFLRFECFSKEKPYCCSGSLDYLGAVYTFSFNQQLETADRHLRGFIKVKDSKGKNLTIKKKDKNGEIKEKEILLERRIYSHDPIEIKGKIEEYTRELYAKYPLEIQSDLFEHLHRDSITPVIAVSKHGKAYVDYCHNKANDSSKEQYYCRLKRAATSMPNLPMSEITETVFKNWQKTNTFTKGELKEMQKFWNFCLLKRICTGRNPIHIQRQSKSLKKDKKNIVKVDKLLPEQSQDLYRYVENNITGPHMGTILAIGAGFKAAEIIELKWSDISIKDENFVVVNDYISERVGATKSYERPLMPWAARIVNKRRDELLEKFTKRQLAKMPIVSSKEDPTKKYNMEALKKDAQRIV